MTDADISVNAFCLKIMSEGYTLIMLNNYPTVNYLVNVLTSGGFVDHGTASILPVSEFPFIDFERESVGTFEFI